MMDPHSVLSCAVGLEVWDCGRAADLLWLQIGRRIPFKSFFGQITEKGEYALHIQCRWRIVDSGRGKIIDGDIDTEDIDAALRELSATCLPLRIDRIAWDEVEMLLRLELEHGYAVEVLSAKHEAEQWRFFRSGVDGSHWVFRDGSLERDL